MFSRFEFVIGLLDEWLLVFVVVGGIATADVSFYEPVWDRADGREAIRGAIVMVLILSAQRYEH